MVTGSPGSLFPTGRSQCPGCELGVRAALNEEHAAGLLVVDDDRGHQ